MKKLLFILSCISILYSCTHNKTGFPVIDVQTGSVSKANLSTITDTLFAIPLETTDECLITDNINLQRDDSLLFIEFDGIIYRFGIDGKFHKQLTRKGQGPGEGWVYGYDLDKDKKQLIVNARGRKMIRFNYDGTLVTEKALKQTLYFRHFSFYNNSFWAVASLLDGTEQWALRVNEEFQYQDSIKLFTPDMPKEVFYFFRLNGYSVVDDNLYVYQPSGNIDYVMRDTLYKVVENQIIPELRVNYGDYKYRENNASNAYESGYAVMSGGVRKSKRFLIVYYGIDTDERPGSDMYVFFYDFATGQKYNLKEGFDDDIFHTGKVEPRPMDIYNKEFYFAKTTEEVSESFPGREDSDNPVIFIMRLKE